MAKKTTPKRVSRSDDDNPEWTKEDFVKARPATDVLEAFRQEGSGWQARINEILRQNMPRRQK